jgi:hypothetical protein
MDQPKYPTAFIQNTPKVVVSQTLPSNSLDVFPLNSFGDGMY